MVLLTEAPSMERLFNLDWQLIADSVLMIIAIFFLFLAMSYLLFQPARKLLSDRQNKIRQELDDAKDNMEQARALREEYESKLQNIETQADTILSEARKNALINESQIIAKAKEEAARIIERGHAEALLEKQKMADDMKKEIISVAAAMAGRVVAASMNTRIQNQLIEETWKEIGGDTWLRK